MLYHCRIEKKNCRKMDADQFKKFMETFQAMIDGLAAGSHANSAPNTQSNASIPYPRPLEVESGDVSENFALFKNNWQVYCIATGMDKWTPEQEKKKVNILLTLIGDAAKKKYSNFDLTEEDQKDTTALLKAIESKIVSNRNILFDRYIFHTCNQMEHEDFDSYLLRLKKAAEFCKYNANVTQDSMLRDRIAFGVKDKNLRRAFLQADPEKLTLEKIIQECKAYELTSERIENLNKDAVNQCSKIETKKKCKFCGQSHAFVKGKCPAFGKTCNYCKGSNHFEEVCRKRKKDVKAVTYESDSDFDYDEITSIENVCATPIKNVKAPLDMKVNGKYKKVKCDVDTGSPVCLIGYRDYCNLMQMKEPKLTQASKKLQNYNGDNIKVKGSTIIRCKEKGKKFEILFYVTESDHAPLLSAKASEILEFVKFDDKVSARNVKKKSPSTVERSKEHRQPKIQKASIQDQIVFLSM